MADFTSDPYIDNRTGREKRHDFGSALFLVAGVGAFLAGKRKIALTKGISKEIMGSGLGRETQYQKYILSAAKKVKSGKSTSMREAMMGQFSPEAMGKRQKIIEDLISDPIEYIQRNSLLKSFPTDEESYNIAINRTGHPVSMFPAWESLGIGERSFFQKFWQGPMATALAPGAPIAVRGEGIPKRVGKYGGMLINRQLHILHSPEEAMRTGRFSHIIPGTFDAGLTRTWGSNLERQRLGLTVPINPKTTAEYIRRVKIGTQSLFPIQENIFKKREYLSRFPNVLGAEPGEDIDALIGRHLADLGDSPQWENRVSGGMEKIPDFQAFMRSPISQYIPGSKSSLTFRWKMMREAAKEGRTIAREAAKSKWEQAEFEAFKFGRKIGIGEEFASYGEGFPQQVEKWVKEGTGWNYKHPGTGETIPFHPRRYNVIGKTLGSNWSGTEGDFFVTSPRETFYRNLNVWSGGTLHRVLQHATGLGISSRHNFITQAISDAIGAKPDSWTDVFIRNLGKTGRAMAIGFGAYYGYKAVNDTLEGTTGVGPSRILAGTYTHARELQQNILQDTGISHVARTLENAFPGSISSPGAHAIRLLSPYFLAKLMEKSHGPAGFRVGLAAGIAFAMITWGDITQSPEELHKIYTGEQEIPVRKGRYWLMGSSPFFGGKIQYYRPHWAALMNSNYQYSGQLWSSRREQWAQGTPFSPILAPILTGHLWDPYYWEKKHHRDRPYPISGELFEPTMPFAQLGNLTIGNIIKPPVLMHRAYLGTEQVDSSAQERGIPLNVGQSMGFPSLGGAGATGGESPFSLKYQAGQAAYSQVEQMGLIGYGVNTLWQQMTGQQNFMADQTVLQSARRATGYERGYYQKELGDPGAGPDEGLTEYFRRIIPHRRSNVEEYNPIPNQMPDWLPSNDYYTNFRTGDPYVKIPYGEARLPGRGYEALHQIHSGIPGVYDTVDRFLVLADIAPYSNEYRQYRNTAISMSAGDPYWSGKVKQALAQRESLNEEKEFLDENKRNVPTLLRPLSSMYKGSISALESAPNPLDASMMKVLRNGYPTHINKWISTQTPEREYKDYLLYGSSFSPWNKPWSSFYKPVVSRAVGSVNSDYVPADVIKTREIEEYFDKLKYVKYSNLSQVARDQGNADLAKRFSKVARNTMAAGYYNEWAAMSAIPKEEKPYFKAFSEAEGKRRDTILGLVPDYMKPYYMTAWNKADGQETYKVEQQSSRNLTAYFKNHYLPEPTWTGYNPDLSIDQVKLRTVKNEGMDIHKFNLWEDNERQLSRQPFTPLIEDINAPSNDMTMLQNTIVSNMEKFGLTDNRVYITRTPSHENSHRINIKIKRDKDKDNDDSMNSVLASMSG